MGKAIFATKVDPTYDDIPEDRYHFPHQYLGQVESTIGDWIIYYEPRRSTGDLNSRGGRSAYFATAKVTSVQPDSRLSGHSYAFVSDFLPFDHSVPFREGVKFCEAGLRRPDGLTNKGAFGRAVRPITDSEYEDILRAGFANLLSEGVPTVAALGEFQDGDPPIFERPIVERVISRRFRDAAFASAVKAAYENTCAVTGLKIINGGGRAEVQAAHIRPVADSGPDSVRNGVALCGTVHWMFDRGLLSLRDDYSILLSAGNVPDSMRGLINAQGKLRLPSRFDLRPHPRFLRFHRENVFKENVRT